MPDIKALSKEVAGLVHAGQFLDAGRRITTEFSMKPPKREDGARAVLQQFVNLLLQRGDLAEVAAILWTPNQFSLEPQCARDVWQLFDDASFGLIMGAGSMGKSYTMGVRLLLEWLRDPDWTTMRLLGPNKDHLEANLFSHIVALHKTATVPLHGEVGELWIGHDRRQQLGSIKGVVVPQGKLKKAARLQGTKRKTRSIPHPVFGKMSRMFIFLDEIENVPQGIWFDIDNVMSNMNPDELQGLKIFGAYNPTNQTDEVGKRAEPKFGWDNLDPEKHYRWTSRRGWEVLRLDGERSENVLQGKVIYPGLQNQAGLDAIAANSGGKQSAGYHTMARGLYPPQGATLTVIPPGMLAKARGEFIWYDRPKRVGGCDLALEGSNASVFTVGLLGLATGFKLPPSIMHPDGEVVMFKDKAGNVTPKWGLQAEQQFKLPKGDTEATANEVIKTCQRAGVKGDYLALDRTGHGAGVCDYIRNNWSPLIHDINYSEGCSTDRIFTEDTKTCNEEYPRIDSELWWTLRKWMEFRFFLIHPQIDMTELTQQLTQRQYTTVGGKTRVESKKDYKARGFNSPDEADSMTLFVYAARKGESLTLSMMGSRFDGSGGGEDDPWPGQEDVRIDQTNMADYLDQTGVM